MTGSARSGWHHRMSGAVAILLATAMLTLVPYNARAACTGDCNNSNDVTVDELLAMVNIALGNADVMTCKNGDANMSGDITIDEILAAVNFALSGCPATTPACGNGVVDSGEDCDTGGICIGGTNAGTACTAEGQCTGDGVCFDGPKGEYACSGDGDCPSSKCIHCKTFGGAAITGDSTHTCAADCSFETIVDVPLVPGVSPDNASLDAGTSGLVVYSPSLNVGIPLPAQATPPNPPIVRHLSIGKQTSDHKIPVVLNAATNSTPGVDVLSGQACICLRPIIYRTCGGTLWEKDGMPSTNCTPGYTDGDSVCGAGKPCTFTYGANNTGAGEIGCDGLNGVNVSTTQNSGGSSGTAGPILTTLSDAGDAGSAVIYVASELGFTINTCMTTPGMMANVYGNDGQFCTSDDPFTTPDPATTGRSVLAQALTTGTASTTVLNANQTDNNTICVGSDSACSAPPLPGSPFSCSALTASPPSASGAALAGAFPDLNAPVIIDIVVTNIQVAQ